MAKAPKKPSEIFQEIIDDYKAVFGDDLVSIILYGSAAGGEYRPGRSDINFMIVLSEKGIERLDEAVTTVGKWRRRNVATPLFLTEHYMETSLDVFPIEYLNFQRRHVPVFGKDVLADLAFKPEHLRLQCEREIKGKMLLLREAFLETSGKARALKEVIGRSIGAFAAVFEALLFLKDVAPPKDRRETIRQTCDAFELDGALFQKLLDIREERIKPGEEEVRGLFKAYLEEVRGLSKKIDALGG